MRNVWWIQFVALLSLSGLVLLSGCGHVDRRVAEDRETCSAMGHAPDTPEFRSCMQELNNRRCANIRTGKGGYTHHEATLDCTKLGTP
jgi:hypothetical protein